MLPLIKYRLNDQIELPGYILDTFFFETKITMFISRLDLTKKLPWSSQHVSGLNLKLPNSNSWSNYFTWIWTWLFLFQRKKYQVCNLVPQSDHLVDTLFKVTNFNRGDFYFSRGSIMNMIFSCWKFYNLDMNMRK